MVWRFYEVFFTSIRTEVYRKSHGNTSFKFARQRAKMAYYVWMEKEADLFLQYFKEKNIKIILDGKLPKLC